MPPVSCCLRLSRSGERQPCRARAPKMSSVPLDAEDSRSQARPQRPGEGPRHVPVPRIYARAEISWHANLSWTSLRDAPCVERSEELLTLRTRDRLLGTD